MSSKSSSMRGNTERTGRLWRKRFVEQIGLKTGVITLRGWRMVKVKTEKEMGWDVQDKVNQEESEQDEVDRMKEEAHFTGKIMLLQSRYVILTIMYLLLQVPTVTPQTVHISVTVWLTDTTHCDASIKPVSASPRKSTSQSDMLTYIVNKKSSYH